MEKLKRRTLKLFLIVLPMELVLALVLWHLKYPLEMVAEYFLASCVLYGFVNFVFYFCRLNDFKIMIYRLFITCIVITPIALIASVFALVHKQFGGLFIIMGMLAMDTAIVNWYIFLNEEEKEK